MGVLRCDRRGCDHVMCDYLILGQTICRECLQEFRALYSDDSIQYREADLSEKFEQFMVMPKGYGHLQDLMTVDDFIKKGIRET